MAIDKSSSDISDIKRAFNVVSENPKPNSVPLVANYNSPMVEQKESIAETAQLQVESESAQVTKSPLADEPSISVVQDISKEEIKLPVDQKQTFYIETRDSNIKNLVKLIEKSKIQPPSDYNNQEEVAGWIAKIEDDLKDSSSSKILRNYFDMDYELNKNNHAVVVERYIMPLIENIRNMQKKIVAASSGKAQSMIASARLQTLPIDTKSPNPNETSPFFNQQTSLEAQSKQTDQVIQSQLSSQSSSTSANEMPTENFAELEEKTKDPEALCKLVADQNAMQKHAAAMAQHIIAAFKDEYAKINFDVDPKGIQGNTRDFVGLVTNFQYFIAEQIVSANDMAAGSALLEQWILVANECLKQKEINSFMAIVTALKATSIYRLDFTKTQISTEAKKLYEEFNEFDISHHDKLIIKTDRIKPIFPYLAPYLTVLTFAVDGKNSKVAEEYRQKLIDSKKNLEPTVKVLDQSVSLEEIIKKTRDIYGNGNIDEGQFNKSLTLEPREFKNLKFITSKDLSDKIATMNAGQRARLAELIKSLPDRSTAEFKESMKKAEVEFTDGQITEIKKSFYITTKAPNTLKMNIDQRTKLLELMQSTPSTEEFENSMRGVGFEFDGDEVVEIKKAAYITMIQQSYIADLLWKVEGFKGPNLLESTREYIKRLNEAGNDADRLWNILQEGEFVDGLTIEKFKDNLSTSSPGVSRGRSGAITEDALKKDGLDVVKKEKPLVLNGKALKNIVLSNDLEAINKVSSFLDNDPSVVENTIRVALRLSANDNSDNKVFLKGLEQIVAKIEDGRKKFKFISCLFAAAVSDEEKKLVEDMVVDSETNNRIMLLALRFAVTNKKEEVIDAILKECKNRAKKDGFKQDITSLFDAAMEYGDYTLVANLVTTGAVAIDYMQSALNFANENGIVVLADALNKALVTIEKEEVVAPVFLTTPTFVDGKYVPTAIGPKNFMDIYGEIQKICTSSGDKSQLQDKWDAMQKICGEMLDGFTYEAFKRFKKLNDNPDEWGNQKNGIYQGQIITSISNLSTKISNWATDLILSEENAEARAILLASIINMSYDAAFKNHDYFTAGILCGVVENGSISRLKTTFSMLPKEIQDRHKKIKALVSPVGGYKKARKEIDQNSAIPFLEMLNLDITHLEEVRPKDGAADKEKQEFKEGMDKILAPLSKMTIVENIKPAELDFLEMVRLDGKDKEIYTKSLQLEPRDSSNSNQSSKVANQESRSGIFQHVRIKEEAAKLILVMDFDGPINDCADVFSSEASVDSDPKKFIKNLDGIFIEADNVQECIHIDKRDLDYLIPLFESLSNNSVKIVCGSQRITYMDKNDLTESSTDEQKKEANLKEGMIAGINKAFGDLVVVDKEFGTSLKQYANSSGTDKNPLLAAAQKEYGNETVPVLLVDDDNGYKTTTRDGGYGFVQVSSAYDSKLGADLKGKTPKTPRSLSERSGAYFKMWLVSLAMVVSPEELKEKVSAMANKFPKEVAWLIKHKDEINGVFKEDKKEAYENITSVLSDLDLKEKLEVVLRIRGTTSLLVTGDITQEQAMKNFASIAVEYPKRFNELNIETTLTGYSKEDQDFVAQLLDSKELKEKADAMLKFIRSDTENVASEYAPVVAAKKEIQSIVNVVKQSNTDTAEEYDSDLKEYFKTASDLCATYTAGFGDYNVMAVLVEVKKVLDNDSLSNSKKIQILERVTANIEVTNVMKSSSFGQRFINFCKNIIAGNFKEAFTSAGNIKRDLKKIVEKAKGVSSIANDLQEKSQLNEIEVLSSTGTVQKIKSEPKARVQTATLADEQPHSPVSDHKHRGQTISTMSWMVNGAKSLRDVVSVKAEIDEEDIDKPDPQARL